MWKISLRGFAAHKGRLVMSALAVVLGVAFVSGTLIFSDTINTSFTTLFTTAAADVTVTPKLPFDPDVEDAGLSGQTATLPATTLAQVQAIPGVKAAHGEITLSTLTVVNNDNKPVGPTSGAPTLGRNWYDTDHPLVRLTDGHAPTQAGEVVIDTASAQRRNVHLGDPLKVITPAGSQTTTVVGIAAFTAANPGIGLALFDTATIQTALLGKPDAYTAITVDVSPATSQADVRQRLHSTLGANYTVTTKAEQAQSSASQISAFLNAITYVLLGFGGLAVLVGIFLILNTFSMLVAARTRELALLRAIGASRRQVTLTVLAEAAVLGLLGATAGLATGIGLAALLKTLIGRAGIDLSGTGLVIAPLTPIAAYTVGVLVTVAGVVIPARRTSAVPPIAAMRQAVAPAAKPLRGRATGGGLLLTAGVAALAFAARQADLTTGAVLLGAGIVCTLVALMVLGPVMARVVVGGLGAPYPLMFGGVGTLSQRNAIRNPGRTGATAAALMIGVALVAASTVLGASLTASVNREVTSTFGADFRISANGNQPIGQDVTTAVRAVSGVDTVTRQRYALAQYRDFEIAVAAVDTATIDRAVRPQYVAGNTDALTAGQVMVDETTATANQLHLGSPVPVRFINGTTATLTVGAISKTPTGGGRDGGVYQVSLDTLARYVPTAPDFMLYINTSPHADTAQVGRDLATALAVYPQATIQNQADYRKQATRQVDLILYLLYGLLALAIVIAILGVINTLALSVIERTREIGLLRAIGSTRPQTRRLIRLESVLIAVHGTLLGLALGLGWGITGQKVLTGYGITVLTIPWTVIGALLVAAAGVGLAAAILPAHRAARTNILTAITTG